MLCSECNKNPAILFYKKIDNGKESLEGYCYDCAKKKGINPTLVKTGIKVYMPDDEVVLLYNRSSNPKKKGLIMANSVGVIDKDYYGNPDNDGHIMFAFYNIKEEDIEIKKGEAIGQALFQKYLITDNDKAEGKFFCVFC